MGLRHFGRDREFLGRKAHAKDSPTRPTTYSLFQSPFVEQEGNLYGLYLAREAHPDGIVYLSEETHYSVAKNVHLLRMPRIIVKAQPNGEIDYQDFLLKVSENKEKPVIVFANLGTTMKEARDDVTRIIALLDTLGIPKNKRHIHVDGALCAPYAEFLSPKPGFDFTDGADSLAVSGHKFIGSPVPCGVVLARKTLVEKVGKKISYIGTTDCTVAGSRSAFAPLVLWYAVRTMGVDGLKARYLDAKELAGYAVERLEKAGIEAWRNPGALTVVLPPVSEELKGKWQLATSKTESHVVVMPGVEKQELDACLDDIIAEHEQKKGIARVDSAVSMAVVETN